MIKKMIKMLHGSIKACNFVSSKSSFCVYLFGLESLAFLKGKGFFLPGSDRTVEHIYKCYIYTSNETPLRMNPEAFLQDIQSSGNTFRALLIKP
jgi:hypothetical protein